MNLLLEALISYGGDLDFIDSDLCVVRTKYF